MSAPAIEEATVLSRAVPELCHVVCLVFTDKAFCGSPTYTDEFCQDENCDHECVVCVELERHAKVCPVCHGACWGLS